MGFSRRLSGTVAFIDNVMKVAVSVLMLAILVGVVVDAVARFFGHPLAGAVEIIADYVMVAIVFLGLGFTFTAGRHISIELFAMYWPLLDSRPVQVIRDLLGAGYFGILTYEGFATAHEAFRAGESSASVLAYPMAPAYATVFVGTGMLTVWLLLQALIGPRNTSGPDRKSTVSDID